MADPAMSNDGTSDDSAAASGAAAPDQAARPTIKLVPVGHDPFVPDASPTQPSQTTPSESGSPAFIQQFQFSPWGRPDQVVGEADQNLAPIDQDALSEAATGKAPENVGSDEARGAGRTTRDGGSQADPQLRIQIDRDLTPDQHAMTVAHELGHVIQQPVPGVQFDAVNAHPTLSKIIQFNSIAAAAGAARGPDYRLVPVDHDPFQQ
jgi:hypothetical protein